MDWPVLEDFVDRVTSRGPVSTPITYHPDRDTDITEALDGSPLRGMFSPTHIDLDVDAGVPVSSRTIQVQVRLADFVNRPKKDQEFTIQGTRYVIRKGEPAESGWWSFLLQRSRNG